MAGAKTVYFCQNCAYQSVKWMGRCPSCGKWNTFAEEIIRKEKTSLGKDNNIFYKKKDKLK